eukprot:GGOE01036714.1.p1 GENE.GGOE01036714.1~~GGOE01036714.1.p1  ORF type:complete len:861 (-),score=211.75 GGOE01036714.1:243-2825(-)
MKVRGWPSGGSIHSPLPARVSRHKSNMASYGLDLYSLESLLEESQSHLPQTDRTTINRDLNSLIQQTNELSAALQFPYHHESRMDAVLAARGFDNEKHRRTLQGVMASRIFSEPPQAVHVGDIGQFLQHRHNTILLTAIEEAKKKTLESHDEAYARTLDAEWKQAKNDLENLLGSRRGYAAPPQVTPMLEDAAPAFPQALPPSPWTSAAPTRPSVMDQRMRAYADQVRELSAAYSRKEESGNPIQKFREGCAQVSRVVATTMERQRLVSESWEIIKFLMEDERPVGRTALTAGTATGAPASQMRLVKASRACLEAQYFQHMRMQLLEQGLQTSMPPRQVVNMYRQQAEQGQRVSPVWANIYFSFRSGQHDAAVEFADEAPGVVPGVVREELRRYQQSSDRQTYEASEQLKGHWRLQSNRAHLGTDPYEVAVYSILMRDEFNRALHALLKTCQDFLWFRLCYIKSVGDANVDPSNPSASTLRAFQAQLLTESSAALKQQIEDRLLWFKALLHAGLFGQAIHHLMTEIDGFQVEAVHFAIALHGAQLLPVTARLEDPLLVQEKVNVFLVVHEYCKFIAPTNATDAVAYYNVLERDNEAIVDDLVINLAVEQGFHAEVFPWTDFSDPYGKSGGVEAAFGREHTRRLAASAAERAHQLGKYSAMVDLYLVAVQLSRGQDDEVREYVNAVLEEVNKLLSCVLQVGTPNRDEFLALARKVDQVLQYLNVGRQVDRLAGRFATFQKLLDFADFFQAIRDEQDNRAIEIAERCDVLPINDADLPGKVRAYRESLDNCIKRDFASFVAGFLHLLRRNKWTLQQSGVRGAEVARIKQRAACVMNFVGQSDIVMSMDVQKRLMDLQLAIAE